MSTFWAVFSALIMAKFCEELWVRYIRPHVIAWLDRIDHHTKAIKKEEDAFK